MTNAITVPDRGRVVRLRGAMLRHGIPAKFKFIDGSGIEADMADWEALAEKLRVDILKTPSTDRGRSGFRDGGYATSLTRRQMIATRQRILQTVNKARAATQRESWEQGATWSFETDKEST